MRLKAAITVHGAPDEVRRQWLSSEHRPKDARESFVPAPGDRGTEIHVELDAGRFGASAARAKLKDGMRHFKQQLETGEIPRSDGTPEGEAAERKLKQRPAQPLDADELHKAGV